MLVETLGNQAGRTAPWGIRADGDRGSQKSRATVPCPFRGPGEAQGCLSEDRLLIRGMAAKIRPLGSQESADPPMVGW